MGLVESNVVEELKSRQKCKHHNGHHAKAMNKRSGQNIVEVTGQIRRGDRDEKKVRPLESNDEFANDQGNYKKE